MYMVYHVFRSFSRSKQVVVKQSSENEESAWNKKCILLVAKKTGPEVINVFSYSTQLSTKFSLLMKFKMPTIVGILTFISMLNTTSERLKARNFFICRYFRFNEQLKFCAHEKSFITSGPGCVVLVFSVASSVRVGLFLRLVDNLLPVITGMALHACFYFRGKKRK